MRGFCICIQWLFPLLADMFLILNTFSHFKIHNAVFLKITTGFLPPFLFAILG